jgi:hypothetical protein
VNFETTIEVVLNFLVLSITTNARIQTLNCSLPFPFLLTWQSLKKRKSFGDIRSGLGLGWVWALAILKRVVLVSSSVVGCGFVFKRFNLKKYGSESVEVVGFV